MRSMTEGLPQFPIPHSQFPISQYHLPSPSSNAASTHAPSWYA